MSLTVNYESLDQQLYFNLTIIPKLLHDKYVPVIYTCQLFLRYKSEIFILGVLEFLKTTRSFPKIPEDVRSLPKAETALAFPSPSLRMRINASSLPVLFTSKIRDREEGVVIYSFYTWFLFLKWVWVNIVLEILTSKMAKTHIFQSGMRNWPASVSQREIEVFNLQAWELAGIVIFHLFSNFFMSHFV